MKKYVGVLLLVAATLFSCKKNVSHATTGSETVIASSNVPGAVLTAFNNSFSAATETEWHGGRDDNFSCQFNFNHQRHEASFDDSGHERNHSIISPEAVPEAVLNAFRANYADIVYEWKLTSDNNWKAHFLRNNIKWQVTLNAAGAIVKAEHD